LGAVICCWPIPAANNALTYQVGKILLDCRKVQKLLPCPALPCPALSSSISPFVLNPTAHLKYWGWDASARSTKQRGEMQFSLRELRFGKKILQKNTAPALLSSDGAG